MASVPKSAVKPFVLLDAGLAAYQEMYAKQLELVRKKKDGTVGYDYLIFVEHPEVYTYGRKSKAPPVGPPSVAVERGGEATFHNPGQLVCYPILSLDEKERDVHLHLRRLEATLVDVLRDFSLKAERREGATGVWLVGKEKKIASIGVAFSSWVSFHGCALNVDNNLAGFRRIDPCGYSSDVMTSLKEELGPTCPKPQDVKESFLRHFSNHFERMLMI